MLLTLQRQHTQYLTLSNLFNVLFLTLALIEFYQPEIGSNLFAEAKKKKVLVVKHVGMGYKKVPVYKKVPYKILKVEIKKKKSKKPWKKWFKKQMIVKIPHEHHGHHGHHGGHHHAASEGHQTWALPAFISTPSSMGEIMEAWPTDYNGNNKQQSQTSAATQATSSSSSLATGTMSNGQQQQQQTAAASTSLPVVQSTAPAPPTSISDLKQIGSELYPSASAFLAEAAAQLVQGSQFAFPSQSGVAAAASTLEQQQQQQQQEDMQNERANRLRNLLTDSNELKHLLGLPSTLSNVVELAPMSSSTSSIEHQQQQQQYQQQQHHQNQQMAAAAAAAAAASNLSFNLAPMVLTTSPIVQSSPVANASTQSQQFKR